LDETRFSGCIGALPGFDGYGSNGRKQNDASSLLPAHHPTGCLRDQEGALEIQSQDFIELVAGVTQKRLAHVHGGSTYQDVDALVAALDVFNDAGDVGFVGDIKRV